MKPLVYAVIQNDRGEIVMSRDEFKRVVDEVYEGGYNDGKGQHLQIPPVYDPLNPVEMPLVNTPITCGRDTLANCESIK